MSTTTYDPKWEAMLTQIKDPGMRRFVNDLYEHRPSERALQIMREDAYEERKIRYQARWEYDWKILDRALEGEFGPDIQKDAQDVSRDTLKPGPGQRRVFREMVQDVIGLELK